MFGAILNATNRSFQKGMPFCRSIYVKEVMKLLAFIFEQPSYIAVLMACGSVILKATRKDPVGLSLRFQAFTMFI